MTTAEEVLAAALTLPEEVRCRLARELMASVSPDITEWAIDDPAFEAELERRFADTEGAVPAAEIWKRPVS